MKIRNGFVSNSSSSSFIVSTKEISMVELANQMLKIVKADWCEYSKNKKRDIFFIGCFKQLFAMSNRISGIILPSTNYETWIYKIGSGLYVQTANNHDWGQLDLPFSYVSGDEGNEFNSNIRAIMNRGWYYDVRCGLVHTRNISDIYLTGSMCSQCHERIFDLYLTDQIELLCGHCFKITKLVVEPIKIKEIKIDKRVAELEKLVVNFQQDLNTVYNKIGQSEIA